MSSRPSLVRRPLALACVVASLSACGAQTPVIDHDEATAAVVPDTTPADEVPPSVEEAADPVDLTTDDPGADDPDGAEDDPGADGAADEPDVPERVVWESNWAIFATVEGIVLQHPAAMVERVGFHESNHAGAQQLEVFEHAVAPITLETRGRATGSRTAADIVVDPDGPIRAPVTGTVLRAGTYVLYCEHADDYVVIEPDARPGWEVKLLHIDGVRVAGGDRVEAGVTELAPRPTPLPFASQVDEHTAEPSWPHVHLEVVDPSVRNPPSGSSC
jgi:hypothetical protein